jgi:L-rhamnose-proton symport protein (RhaT)
VAPSLALGIILTLFAGVLAGNCMLPMSFTRRWSWENTWLIFSLVSLVVIPWSLALALVNHLSEIYRTVNLSDLAIPMLFGFGWGIAQVLFGISVKRLGLGLAYAIIVGLGALLGTLVPLLVQHRSEVSRAALVETLLGVVAMIVGIVLSTWGGQIRERSHRGLSLVTPAGGYTGAVMLAIVCGLLAPMLNYAFAFGQNITIEAVRFGNSPVRAVYSVWPIGLAGGLLPNVGYSLYRLAKNRSWDRFRRLSPDIFWSALMGVLWMGAFALYGMSSSYLGPLGTSIGWGLFQIFMIMTATLSGVWVGEWKGAPRSSRLLVAAGLLCMTLATTLLARVNR